MIEEHTNQHSPLNLNSEKVVTLIKSLSQREDPFQIPVPNEEGKIIWEEKHLMFQTTSGPALRPETAISTFSIFNDLYHQTGGFPIRVFQLGKAFRNEPNPKNLLLRMREFTQLEVQLIFKDSQQIPQLQTSSYVFPILNPQTNQVEELTSEELLVSGRLYEPELIGLFHLLQGWINSNLGLTFDLATAKVRYVQHLPDELTFYAKDGWDLELYLEGFGWTEVAGIHNRGTHDLTQQS